MVTKWYQTQALLEKRVMDAAANVFFGSWRRHGVVGLSCSGLGLGLQAQAGHISSIAALWLAWSHRHHLGHQPLLLTSPWVCLRSSQGTWSCTP